MTFDELRAAFGHVERYEFAAFADNVAAGEEIFIVLREASSRLASLTEDFWMFNERQAAVMRYDEQEPFVEASTTIELIDSYITCGDFVMKYAVPFESWMTEHN